MDSQSPQGFLYIGFPNPWTLDPGPSPGPRPRPRAPTPGPGPRALGSGPRHWAPGPGPPAWPGPKCAMPYNILKPPAPNL